ncbi:MAG: DUF4465 domain-containing protein [Bacteroidaceae bacterium]|nr:DUF4465 domain-containing protein [Bacteroidaceae bacterium]
MKRFHFLASALLAVMVFASCEPEGNDVVEKVATFEGPSWAALIDSPEYGGKMLYGVLLEDGYSYSGFKQNLYTWTDPVTGLSSSGLLNTYGPYSFASGGIAVSNYVMSDYTKASYLNQLSVSATPLNGNNFCVLFGTGEPGTLPYLYFPAGEEHVVKSMSIVPTSYLLNTLKNGDGWGLGAIQAGQFVDVVAYGYDANGKLVKETSIRIADGQKIITNWTNFDLSTLGKINKLEMGVTGNVTNDWGFAEPAYFAFDNIVVEFEE